MKLNKKHRKAIEVIEQGTWIEYISADIPEDVLRDLNDALDLAVLHLKGEVAAVKMFDDDE